jgi:hypothetical protein
VSLVLETGEAREVHHFSLLIGYGVSAINPYLAFESLDRMLDEGLLTGIDYRAACRNFVKAASKGVIKVASKMGISSLQSYRGAQVFEAVGLRQDLSTSTSAGRRRASAASARRSSRRKCCCVIAPRSATARSRVTRCRSAASTSGAPTASIICSTPSRSTGCRNRCAPAATRISASIRGS